MAFDIEMIEKVYANLADRVEKARELVGRPLTLSEKILYSHLWEELQPKHSQEEKTMLILHRTVLRVKMQLLKWLYYSLCMPEKVK